MMLPAFLRKMVPMSVKSSSIPSWKAWQCREGWMSWTEKLWSKLRRRTKSIHIKGAFTTCHSFIRVTAPHEWNMRLLSLKMNETQVNDSNYIIVYILYSFMKMLEHQRCWPVTWTTAWWIFGSTWIEIAYISPIRQDTTWSSSGKNNMSNNLLFHRFHTVDGQNPKQPPGMLKTL